MHEMPDSAENLLYACACAPVTEAGSVTMDPRGAAAGAPAGGSDILSRLRVETRVEHVLLEASLDVLSGELTRARYLRLLRQFLGVHASLEPALQEHGGWSERGIELRLRLKVPLLEADLRALGEPAPERLPRHTPIPAFADTEAAFGCLYVVEGATLGGQLISRHILRTLDITPENGGSFFHAYGERTGEMWRSFRRALVEFVDAGAAQDRIVASALATFAAFRHWCGGSHELP
jgi:heme oxygenase